eukprot:359724-Chlamydomonas_euryale.AAC.5
MPTAVALRLVPGHISRPVSGPTGQCNERARNQVHTPRRVSLALGIRSAAGFQANCELSACCMRLRRTKRPLNSFLRVLCNHAAPGHACAN